MNWKGQAIEWFACRRLAASDRRGPKSREANRRRSCRAPLNANVQGGVHYLALHLHLSYRGAYGLRRGMFPNAEWISDRTLSIPFGHGLSDNEAGDVLRGVRMVLER